MTAREEVNKMLNSRPYPRETYNVMCALVSLFNAGKSSNTCEMRSIFLNEANNLINQEANEHE